METCPSLACLLKRFIFLALAGCALLLFAKAILAILVMLVAFAIIGLLVWLPLHTLFFGRHNAWRIICEQMKLWRRPLEITLKVTGSQFRAAMGRWFSGLLEVVSGAVVAILVAGAANAPASAAFCACARATHMAP